MAFRNDDVAARARIDSLEGEVERLRQENEALKRGDAPVEEPPRARREPSAIPGQLTVLLGALVVAAAYLYGSNVDTVNGQLGLTLTLVGVGVVTLGVSLWVTAHFLVVVSPGEIAVIAGRRYVEGGIQRGYRVVTGGRAIRIPMLETVTFMSTRPRSLETLVRGAYAKGNEPVDVELAARVKVARFAPLVHAAVERFLGRDLEEVARVASETLEGACRAVVAQHTEKEMGEDPERFAAQIIEASDDDMRKLGIDVDTLRVVAIEATR